MGFYTLVKTSPTAQHRPEDRVARLRQRSQGGCLGIGPIGVEGLCRLLDEQPCGLAAPSPDAATEVARTAFGPLLDLPEAGQAALLDTLGRWFATGGSTIQAAEQLHCHRTAVLHRRNRITELTGR
ncbi:helix-turn-helix domain-containing protein [Streptomyces sp. NPDC096057]|uniref:helix-turn-helix domain-containing protein n=1 Tax=Streptomyces sp. NPDC096057 TaxID=3155543 RepID=UPI0033200C5D